MLDGVNVALGVTGSIAAVRGVELIHELQRHGASVRVVTSPAAADIINPWALEFASGHQVVERLTGAVEHIELCGTSGWADVFVVAPATANTVGKVAHAIDDTPVTTCATTAIGSGIPLVIAPAMHEPMYDHPGVVENLERLRSRYDVTIVDPRLEEGKAKIAEDEAIVIDTARATGDRPLEGRRIAVTSGPTHEMIDPVRMISTRASGRTGQAVAKALYIRGAEVELIRAEGDSVTYATVHQARSASDMEVIALDLIEDGIDAYVSAAAIGDYSVEPTSQKLPSGETRTLDLSSTPKVIRSVREAAPSLPIVGFKAESTEDDTSLEAAGRELLEAHQLTFVVANHVSVMGADEARILVLDESSTESFEGSKDEVADTIADRIADSLR